MEAEEYPISERFRISIHPIQIYRRRGNSPDVSDGVLIQITDKCLSDNIAVACIKDINTAHGLIAGFVSERTGIPIDDCEDLVGIIDSAFLQDTHTNPL